MIVGTLKRRLLLRDGRSRKDKRRVLRGPKDVLHGTFDGAAAGNEGGHVQSLLSGVLNDVRFFGGVQVVAEEQKLYGE